MPVFISHKSEDKPKAAAIAQYLIQRQVECYLDALDPELKTTDDITNTIVKRVNQCSHLMAVISTRTKDSWWVPFEIGVGTDSDKRICSYRLEYTTMPEFLEKWPILKQQSDLDLFVDYYRKDKAVLLKEARSHQPEIFDASTFHRRLKTALRQTRQQRW